MEGFPVLAWWETEDADTLWFEAESHYNAQENGDFFSQPSLFLVLLSSHLPGIKEGNIW